MYFIPKFGCRNKSIEIPVIVAVVICNKYSDALVKKLQLKDCTFAQKAGFSMHFHCRLTADICSVHRIYVDSEKTSLNILTIINGGIVN